VWTNHLAAFSIGLKPTRVGTEHNKRHGGSFPLQGIHPATPVLLRKTRPANGLWAKPGNSQGSSLRSLALTRCAQRPLHHGATLCEMPALEVLSPIFPVGDKEGRSISELQTNTHSNQYLLVFRLVGCLGK
jgi:hypothetical protein